MKKLVVIVVCGVALLSAGVAVGASRSTTTQGIHWPASCGTWKCVNRHLNSPRSTHLGEFEFVTTKPAGGNTVTSAEQVACPRGGWVATGGGAGLPGDRALTPAESLDSYPTLDGKGWRADFGYTTSDASNIAATKTFHYQVWVLCQIGSHS